MNTNNLKRFAKEARIKLLEQVGRKVEFVLLTDTAELRGKQKEIEQLKRKIEEQGKETIIETVAYTWFNRLMALRFMDANGYTIPKVVTPLAGMTNPEILQNALAGNVEPELKVDHQRLNDLLDNKTAATDAHTEAYKMLLVASCNQWHAAMPFMFERISDYNELLLPDDLLSDYSIVADIRNGMSDEDCQQEELIGWLYQFYIADKKDDVFEGLKKNIKITAENIPAATQLFTPRWIVRYMVENTLGKLWLTFKPSSKIRQHMPYYIEAPEGNAPAPFPDGIQGIKDITFLDPCQGSGHVLVYAFDLFSKIYEEEGYNTNEIPALILEHNLFGIDIDERAAQLAAFALTMKARSYYPRFLRKPVPPNVIALDNVHEDIIKQSVKLPLQVDGKMIYDYKDLSLYHLTQADNYGSLIQIDPEELKALSIQKGSIWQEQEQKLKEQAEYLSRQYHCVVTNPPYLGSGGMNVTMSGFVKNYFPKSKSDLMACFIERCLAFNQKAGKTAIINQQSWMFLSSYVELRMQLIEISQFENLLHLGPRTFPEIGGEVVQNTAFVLGNYQPNNKTNFIKLTDFSNARLKDDMTLEAIRNPNCSWNYIVNQKDLQNIPGNPISFWVKPFAISIFNNYKPLKNYASPAKGMMPGPKFIRFHWEVNKKDLALNILSHENSFNCNLKWYPYFKGGEFRKWYGNREHVVDFMHDGQNLKKAGYGERNPNYYFLNQLNWTKISSSKFGIRDGELGGLYDDAACQCPIINERDRFYLLAYLNSKLSNILLSSLSNSLNFSPGEISKIPTIYINEIHNVISNLGKECTELSKEDWNLREQSREFKGSPLIEFKEKIIKKSITLFYEKWLNIFSQLLSNEIEINKIFIDYLKIGNEINSDLDYTDITLLKEEIEISEGKIVKNIKSLIAQLISYSVGCLFGRYSLYKQGLILANQGETLGDYLKQVSNPTFMPDEDNIIPVLDGEWFNDDIVGRFKVFLMAAFGEEQFEENLKFIEETIGKDIRKYFVKDFYNDHIKRYKKRPIYWMFSSPKGHFKALIYMHRYQPDLCSKMLNDYLQAFISKLEAAKQTQTMLTLREDITAREKTVAIKEIDKLEAMLKDCREYEKTLFTLATQKISIDLDDGVKVNYQKFKEVLVPIKGLEKEEE